MEKLFLLCMVLVGTSAYAQVDINRMLMQGTIDAIGQMNKYQKTCKGFNLWCLGRKCLAEGNYETALDKFIDSWEKYEYYPALNSIGECYELGIGCSRNVVKADEFYLLGARDGAVICKISIERIKKSGHWSVSYRNQYIKDIKNSISNSNNQNSVGIYNGSVSGTINTQSNSSNNRRLCPGCNGSGKGSEQIIYSPNYTGLDNSVYCSTCGRMMSAHSHYQPACGVCHGRGFVE
jgi:hypothetical protein